MFTDAGEGQIGIVSLDGQIELEALRLYGLPEAAPALLCGTPTLPVGQHEFAAETTLDLPFLAGGAVHLVDVAVAGARQGDRAEAALASSTRFIELDAFAWSNNMVRVLARNVSGAPASTSARRRCRSPSPSGGCLNARSREPLRLLPRRAAGRAQLRSRQHRNVVAWRGSPPPSITSPASATADAA